MLPDYAIVDAHIHIQPWAMIRPEAHAALLSRGRSSMHEPSWYMDPDAGPARLLAYMDANGIEQIAIINYVAPDVLGFQEHGVNEFSAAFAARAPGRIIPFGGVDVHDPVDIDRRMDYILGGLGIKALKIHPPHQLVYANAYRDGGLPALATVYQKALEYRVPVMIHTATYLPHSLPI